MRQKRSARGWRRRPKRIFMWGRKRGIWKHSGSEFQRRVCCHICWQAFAKPRTTGRCELALGICGDGSAVGNLRPAYPVPYLLH
eukprot:2803421-Rhodomonas_salina.1